MDDQERPRYPGPGRDSIPSEVLVEGEPTLYLDSGAPEPVAVPSGGPPEEVPEYALVVYKGQQVGRTWPLADGITRVGRTSYSDITLDHITVSRRHCEIDLDPSGLSIKDLGSTNGSYVNDQLVEKSSLDIGDRLMIGTFHLLVARGR